MRRVLNGLVAACILAVASGNAFADESGVPFWLSGQYASLAAVPTTPGWSLVSTAYYYNGSADKTTTFQHGNTLSTGIKSDSPLLLLQLGYATEKLYGTTYYVYGNTWFQPAYGANGVYYRVVAGAIGSSCNPDRNG